MKKPIISLTLDNYMVRDLDYIAKYEHRSRSAMVEILLMKGMLEWQKENTNCYFPAYEEEHNNEAD